MNIQLKGGTTAISTSPGLGDGKKFCFRCSILRNSRKSPFWYNFDLDHSLFASCCVAAQNVLKNTIFFVNFVSDKEWRSSPFKPKDKSLTPGRRLNGVSAPSFPALSPSGKAGKERAQKHEQANQNPAPKIIIKIFHP